MVLMAREPRQRAQKRSNNVNAQRNARNKGRRAKGGQEAPPREEKQRQYLNQLNQQAEIAMRVLEREKAELKVMKEKVIGSRSSEGKRKIFDKSQIPGLSPRADDKVPGRLSSPQGFDNIEVPKYRNDLSDIVEEQRGDADFDKEKLRSPGFDSPVHSPLPVYATPEQAKSPGVAAHSQAAADDPGMPRRNLFQPRHDLRDEDLPPSVQKRMEILSTMRENKRRQMSHNSFWSVENDPRVVSPAKLHQKNADMYKKGGFLSAMRELQGGPSEEQRRIAELQRQKLLQDLDEQVRRKREEKRNANIKRKLQEEQAERRARMAANRAIQQQPKQQAYNHMSPIEEIAVPQRLSSPPAVHQHHSPVLNQPAVSERALMNQHQAPQMHRPVMQQHAPQMHSPVMQQHAPQMHSPVMQQHVPQVHNPVMMQHVVPQVHNPEQMVYRSPVPRARRKFEIENASAALANQNMNRSPVALQNYTEAAPPHNDAISDLLSEIRHEQKMLRQQFQEQMQVVSKLEEGARAASEEHKMAMFELRKVKNDMLVDSLDEFSVATNYVPKAVAQIPDDSNLPDIEIRLATAGKGKPRESFEDALNGFLVTRESVYLDQDDNEEPTLSPLRVAYPPQDDDEIIAEASTIRFPVEREAVQEKNPQEKKRTKMRRKKRTQQVEPPVSQRWKL